MKMCPKNEPTPSREMLRAFALGELHGDGAAELAAHVEHCADCAKRVRVLTVLERCDQVLQRVRAECGRMVAAWQRIKAGALELGDELVISVKEQRGRLVRWAHGMAFLVRDLEPQLLALGEGMQVVKEIPIAPGAGVLECSLRVFRDAQGVTRIGVSFGDRTGGGCGVLRAVLSRGGSVKESKSVADVSGIVFDAQLSPGDYVVQLRSEDEKYNIRITVD